MTQELIVADQTYMPAMSIQQAVQRFNTLVEFVQTAMRPNVDYGVIPGTPKPTLLKPGAEKLTTLFGLTTRFQIIEKTEDWAGSAHGDEPFFYYLYRCQLWRGERLIAESDGSCNSREGKYRWREAKRTCPECGQAAIIKGKAEYGGGWLCFKKQGGCNAKFRADDPAIVNQQAGKVPNPDIADQVNTIQKMAQKRALIAAVLIGVNASEFFTQDAEDMQMIGNGATYAPPVQILDTATGELREPSPAERNPRRVAIMVRLAALVEEAEGIGMAVPEAATFGGMDETTLLTAGKALRARIDTAKRDLASIASNADMQAEYDAIDAETK